MPEIRRNRRFYGPGPPTGKRVGAVRSEAPGRSGLEKIIRQTERIAGLIRALLDVARTDAGNAVPVDLPRVIDRAAEILRSMFPAATLELDLEPDLPPVWGYPRRLEHAVLNLMINGCQAMEGRGALRLSIGRIAAESTGLEMFVEDHGCGIAPENLERIFQPFFSTKVSGEGSGLGLSLVDRVIREIGGSIRVRSRPGSTRFSIFLPTAEKKEA